jgi:hypothetical protein
MLPQPVACVPTCQTGETARRHAEKRIRPSLRAKRSNPAAPNENWIASSLTLLAMTEITLWLIAYNSVPLRIKSATLK